MAEDRSPKLNTKGAFDFKTVYRDVKERALLIFLLCASLALLAGARYISNYRPVYTVEATYAVTTHSGTNNGTADIMNAQNAAMKFSEVVSSSVMSKRLSEDLEDNMSPGSVSAEVIPETNLISLKVRSSDMKSAFHTVRSVMKNYRSITDLIIGDTRLNVMVQPRIPDKPDNEFSPLGLMARVFFLSLAAMLFVIIVMSYLKDTIRSPSDMQNKTETEFLGAISHENKYRTLRDKIKKPKKSILINSPLVSFRFAESVMKCAKRIQNRMDSAGAKTLLVTSCMENEGKSTLAANVALALARGGERVAIVDMDFRRPAQSLIFGIGKSSGKDIHKLDDEDEVYLVTNAGNVVRQDSELNVKKLEEFVGTLEKHFDYILLDTAPMDRIADTEAIATVADASLCVVREHTALVRDINNMIENLACYKAAPIGSILNDSYGGWQESMGGYEYRRRYGYGYGYGEGNGRGRKKKAAVGTD